MKKLGGKRKMRNKKLWKNLMLVTTLTVALGTVSATALAEDDVTLAGGTQVTAFASEGDIDGGIAVEAQAEQTAPEAATTDAEATTPEAEQTEQTTPEATAPEVEQTAPEAIAPEEVSPETIVPEQIVPEATAPEAEAIPETDTVADATNVTINVSSGAVTFDGSSDIVLTYTITADGDFMVSNDGPMLGESMAYPLYEKVSETEHRFTITKDTLKRLIDMGMEDDMSVVFNPNYCVITGEDTLHYFPKVTLTYDAGNDNGGDNGNGDNGNGETPEKPENPDPDNGNGGNGNGETPEKPENPDPDNGNGDNGDNNNGGDNGNGETPEKPENPDPEKPENPDNGGDNGDNQNPDGDNNQTPETPDNGDDNKDVQDWMTLTPAQKVTTTTQTQTPQTQTVSTTQTAPKTGDAASTLPLLGTGLTSLGVALGAIFKKRR